MWPAGTGRAAALPTTAAVPRAWLTQAVVDGGEQVYSTCNLGLQCTVFLRETQDCAHFFGCGCACVLREEEDGVGTTRGGSLSSRRPRGRRSKNYCTL